MTAGPARRLPGEIEVAAYLVVAEALTNVLKHVKVSRAAVRVAAVARRGHGRRSRGVA